MCLLSVIDELGRPADALESVALRNIVWHAQACVDVLSEEHTMSCHVMSLDATLDMTWHDSIS